MCWKTLLRGTSAAILALICLAVDARAQRQFPHTFHLDSRSADTVQSPGPTSPRHRYRITAWGTYSMWEDTLNSSVDPVWIYSFPKEEWDKPEWRLFGEGYPIYVGDDRMYDSHGLRINGRPFPKLEFNAVENRYSTVIQGNGRPITAAIVDWNFKNLVKRDAHDNNSGVLTVLVEELPITELELCAIDSSRFPVIRVSAKVLRDSIRYEAIADKLILTENGIPVRIDSVNCAERTMPVSVAMVFDRSGSMRDAFGNSTRLIETKSAGKKFVDKLTPIDEAAIYSFSDATTFDQNWTSNKLSLRSAIDRLVANGYTAMNDAIIRAIDDIEARPAEFRKAVVVLSDGEDNRSAVRDIGAVIRRAQQAKVPVFAIGLLLDTEDSLRLLTAQTGGRYFGVKDAAAMDSVFAGIGELVFEKGCCSMYYVSPDARRNGSFRMVSASVGFPNDTLLVRDGGYRAPSGVSAAPGPESGEGSAIVSVAPNPASGSTVVRYRVGRGGDAVLSLLDIEGRVVETLFSGTLDAGEHLLDLSTAGLASGRYFVRLALSGETYLYSMYVVR